MTHAGSPPGDPRPASALVWVLPTAVTAAAALTAALLVSPGLRAPIFWIGLAATLSTAVVAAEAARRGRAAAALRQEVAAREAALARQEAETVRLAEQLLPHVVARLRQGDFPDDVLAGLGEDLSPGLTEEFRAAHRAVLRTVVDVVSAEEDLRDSAQRAFVNIARRVQAIVHQQAGELRDMEDRHGQNHEVFGDLLRLDHGTALIGRLADSIAVLGGARPGRQWNRPVPLFSVLRGGMSRIIDYQRVELHSVTEVAVVGPAVEPLIHTLAELLDNATRYSPPQTRVHLTAVEVQSGVAIEIEDGGVSLSEEARRRAERMLQQAQEGLDLADLGETPRLGLAVVGRLARAYDFKVSLRTSAYGGVRAVLIVPQELITTAPATGRAHGIGASSGPRPTPTTTGSASAPASAGGTLGGSAGVGVPAARAAAAPATTARPLPPARPENDRDTSGGSGPEGLEKRGVEAESVPEITERTPSGLPQRRRRARAAAPATAPPGRSVDPVISAASAAAADTTDPPGQEAPPVQPGMWMAAFQSGISGESTAAPSAGQTQEKPSEKSEQP
ncbi:sensor histidine kinase [Streptomyces durbertensis]|uniref:histidine kinase n=1 Tax=Streptomyces durbertensis TaxID=2448886 RepID=A0ABR6EJT0_9ACTN|nr:sensor histidine kinase [Streptomyces durbertensis]MBB1245576.1 sensor histidine kinase [Streptomyces durbertensis]